MYFFLLDPLPTLSAVIRGPTGRYVWTMQLRQFSRQKNVQYFMLFIQLIRLYCSMRNLCNLIGLEQWYFSLIQLMYTFEQWNQPCLRWQLKNWMFLLFFYFFLNQSLILEFLLAAMTPDTFINSYAKFYALQLVDDLFVKGLKSPCSK